jgi:hypothetical protein
VDDGALEALDDAEILRRPGCERGVHLGRTVEVAAPIRVELLDGSCVIRERQRVHPPTATVEPTIARRSSGDVRLQAPEVVDRVEAGIRSARLRQIRRRVDRPIQLPVDLERRTRDPAGSRKRGRNANESHGSHGDDKDDALHVNLL